MALVSEWDSKYQKRSGTSEVGGAWQGGYHLVAGSLCPPAYTERAMLQAKVAAVFSFRGSQPYQLKDWMLDISFLPTAVGWAPGCQAHAGFLRAFNSVSVTPETATKQGVQHVLQDLIDRYNLGHKNGNSLAISKLTRCASY